MSFISKLVISRETYLIDIYIGDLWVGIVDDNKKI
jgi:hypothetical protein